MYEKKNSIYLFYNPFCVFFFSFYPDKKLKMPQFLPSRVIFSKKLDFFFNV